MTNPTTTPEPLPPHVALAIERFEQACEGVFSGSGTARPVKARAALEQAIQQALAAARKVADL